MLIHYRQWSHRYDEWFDWNSACLRPLERVQLRREGLQEPRPTPVRRGREGGEHDIVYRGCPLLYCPTITSISSLLFPSSSVGSDVRGRVVHSHCPIRGEKVITSRRSSRTPPGGCVWLQGSLGITVCMFTEDLCCCSALSDVPGERACAGVLV